MPAESLLVTSSNDLRERYLEDGYVVARSVIPAPVIDRLLEMYENTIVPSKRRFFRQNTGAYERNRISEHGYVLQSFLDIHAYDSFPEFKHQALSLFFHPNMVSTLSAITETPRHNLMQTMLFDQNTETQPHQDWWYLDSVPHGHLLAAWIAMEDIKPEAGRFFVVDKSHRVVLHEEGMAHSEWLARIRRYYEEHQDEVHAPALKKGDVLFWNSRTIHGALRTIDPRHSRKSLTAHYLPDAYNFGNLFLEKDWVRFRDFSGFKHFSNQPEYSLRSMTVSAIKSALYDHPALLKLLRRFQRGAISDL